MLQNYFQTVWVECSYYSCWSKVWSKWRNSKVRKKKTLSFIISKKNPYSVFKFQWQIKPVCVLPLRHFQVITPVKRTWSHCFLGTASFNSFSSKGPGHGDCHMLRLTTVTEVPVSELPSKCPSTCSGWLQSRRCPVSELPNKCPPSSAQFVIGHALQNICLVLYAFLSAIALG